MNWSSPSAPDATRSRTATTGGLYRNVCPGIRQSSRCSCEGDELLGLALGGGERLLDEEVLSGCERGDADLVVRGHRRRDDDCLDFRILDELLQLAHLTS